MLWDFRSAYDIEKLKENSNLDIFREDEERIIAEDFERANTMDPYVCSKGKKNAKTNVFSGQNDKEEEIEEVEEADWDENWEKNYQEHEFVPGHAVIRRVVPNEGPLEGGIKVRLFGEGFVNVSRLSVLFSVKGVPARFISENEIETIAPRWSKQHTGTLFVYQDRGKVKPVKHEREIKDSQFISKNFLQEDETTDAYTPVHYRWVNETLKQSVCRIKGPRHPSVVENQVQLDEQNESPFELVSSDVSGIHHVQQEKKIAPECFFSDTAMLEYVMHGASCDAEYMTGGVAVGDFNNDGFADLAFSRIRDSVVIYKNNGDGTFTDVTIQLGMNTPSKFGTNGLQWGDINNDGLLDLYVVGVGGRNNHLFIQQPDGTFVDEGLEREAAIASPFSHAGHSVLLADFDGDGYLDIHVVEWHTFSMRSHEAPVDVKSKTERFTFSRLLLNRGEEAPGFFRDVTHEWNITIERQSKFFNYPPNLAFGFSQQLIDLDGDGFLDLIVQGDFGTSVLYWGTKNGFTTESHESAGIGAEQNAMGAVYADFNKDGLMDIFVTAIYDESKRCINNSAWCVIGWKGNSLYINQGNRSFVNEVDNYGVKESDWAWGTAYIDIENDGEPELFVANGFSTNGDTFEDDFNLTPNKLYYRKPGVKKFKDIAPQINMNDMQEARAVVMFDMDNDGDLDMVVVRAYKETPLVYKNKVGQNLNYLRINVMHYLKNTPYHGAMIEVHVTEDQRVPIIRQSLSSNVLWGHSEYVQHIGIGKEKSIFAVIIKFPRQNVTRTFYHVEANQELIVRSPYPYEKDSNRILNEHDVPSCKSNVYRSMEKTQSESLKQEKTSPIGKSQEDIFKQLYKVTYDGYKKVLNRKTTMSPIALSKIPTFQEFRTLDGSGNNINDPKRGSSFSPLLRYLPNAYEDGKQSPSGSNRPSAREISNIVFDQRESIPSKANINELFTSFGQFIAHDMDFSSPLHSFRVGVNFPIRVPIGDYYFDRDITGTETIRFKRSGYTNIGHGDASTREQINKVSSYIDGSMIYGSDDYMAQKIRTFKDGQLAVTNYGLPPKNVEGRPIDNPMNRKMERLHYAGDIRINEQPILVALHTVFVREHNRVSKLFKEAHPEATDEQLYQWSRMWNLAVLQNIVYSEYLPTILGPFPEYKGYDEDENVSISNIFATAAFRFGHSMVRNELTRLNEKGKPIPEGPVLLRDAYFNSEPMLRQGGLSAMLRGAFMTQTEEMDAKMVDGLRNFLFGNTGKHSGAMDLAALNIQRGRDHGLPSFMDTRRQLGLHEYTSFYEITKNKETAEQLQKAYHDNLELIDLWVGGLAEDHVENGSIGTTFAFIMTSQFSRLRNGDRFYYENLFKDHPELIKVIKEQTLWKLLQRNIALSDIESDENLSLHSFLVPDIPNSKRQRDDL